MSEHMLESLVARARRRLILNDLLNRGVNAACVALAALILLLLLGTQIMEWQWAALLPAAALAYGILHTWRGAPSPYRAAQIVDRELSLADTLSTALYFSQPEAGARLDGQVREWQHRQAERVAGTADVRMATPFRMPRAAYAGLALLLVASSLLALRYGLTHTLDLKQPLAAVLNLSGSGDRARQAAANHKKKAPRALDFLEQMGISLGDPAEQAAALEKPEDASTKNASQEMSEAETARVISKSDTEEGDRIAGDEGDGDTESGQAATGDPNGEGPQAGDPKEGQQASKNQPQNASENSSLMQKFKDAMKDLLSKLKQPPNQGSQQQQGSQNAQNGKQGKQQGPGKQSGAQNQKQDGAQQGEAEDGQQGEESQSAKDAQGKGDSDANQQRADKQPGSGVGKQDGDKELKLAEQMAAMGKLSEIIGKRSANVTGEAMVEVHNTSQQLTTRYESRRAAHGETGAEINRDEVPVTLEGYVQGYFEQVRKQPPPKK